MVRGERGWWKIVTQNTWGRVCSKLVPLFISQSGKRTFWSTFLCSPVQIMLHTIGIVTVMQDRKERITTLLHVIGTVPIMLCRKERIKTFFSRQGRFYSAWKEGDLKPEHRKKTWKQTPTWQQNLTGGAPCSTELGNLMGFAPASGSTRSPDSLMGSTRDLHQTHTQFIFIDSRTPLAGVIQKLLSETLQ